MTAKKLLALALASGYFLSVGCRFACAGMMSAQSRGQSRHAVASEDTPACHRHASKPQRRGSRGAAPCCMTDAGTPALVNAAVAAPSATRALRLGGVAVDAPATIAAEPRALGADSSPPLRRSLAVVLSALSPRAPPFPPAVL